jgi:hypothetical protein
MSETDALTAVEGSELIKRRFIRGNIDPLDERLESLPL